MDQLNKDLITFLCLYISQEDLNILRQCSKYYSVTIGKIYFRDHRININILTRKNKHEFRSFVHKYSLSCNFENIKTLEQLSYIRTYNNINSISFYRTFDNELWIYLMPLSLQKIRMSFTELKDQIINENTFPKDLKEFKMFSNNLKEPSQYFKFLPDSLETLIFINTCNYDINSLQKILPRSLKNLVLACKFDKLLTKNIFPNSLMELTLGGYNQSIEVGVLPSSLTRLHISAYPYQSIKKHVLYAPIKEHVLPASLIELQFSIFFNQPIEKNVLPQSLKILKFGAGFNKPIEENVLPLSLTSLHFGSRFNQPIKKMCYLKVY
jgi:uncharacterized protein YozE (UPF0346 family)